MKNKQTRVVKYDMACALTLMAVLTVGSAQAAIVFNDSFTDGGRNNGSDKQDTNWWTTTTANAIEVSKGSLGLVSGSSGRGIRATFAPQRLSIGKAVKATFVFVTPKTIGVERGSAFRIGLYNKLGRTALESDQAASSKNPNEIYNGLPGYMIDYDVGVTNSNINIRKHESATVGRLLSSISGYDTLSSSGQAYVFAPHQTYTGTITIQQSANFVQISGTLEQNGKLLSRHTVIDPGAKITNIGMLAFHVMSKTFGSSKVPDTPDNGIDFKNVKVERLH